MAKFLWSLGSYSQESLSQPLNKISEYEIPKVIITRNINHYEFVGI